MNILPAEILNNICIPLHQQEKIEFMRVCRSWKEMITKRYLYHTICLCNKQAMQYLIEKFQKEPHFGNQVENLIVEQFQGGYDDMNKLPTLLSLMPNLRYFYHQAWYGSYVNVQSLIQPWCRRIEHLAIQGSRSITVNLIFYNKLEQIRNLYISRKNVFDPGFFTKLTTLHTLTELTLDHCGANLTFFHIEYLFEKLTLLESLAISQSSIKSDVLPLDISPATKLKKLHLSFIQSTDVKTRVAWLQYIGIKFPNLSDFRSRYVSDGVSEEVDGLGNKTSITEGYTSLFHGLGSNLKKLDCQSLSLPHSFFEILDNAGCKLQHLKLLSPMNHSIFAAIGDSRQAECIQKIEVHFESLSDLQWLSTMTGLKTLVVRMVKFKRPIHFNALLNMCPPTLESLEIFQMTLSVGFRFQHSLKSLTLTKCRVLNSIGLLLSKYLQQLHILKLYYCTYTYDNANVLNIPNHSLSLFEMIDSENRPYFSVLAVTPKGKRLYTSGYKKRKLPFKVDSDGMTSLSPPTKCSLPDPRTYHDFTLKCTSVAKVIL